MRFEAGETAILEIISQDSKTAQLRNVNSLAVTVTNPDGVAVVTAQPMVNDSLGNYHYDYLLPTSAPLGIYEVLYVATSGTRITRQRDSFEVHD